MVAAALQAVHAAVAEVSAAVHAVAVAASAEGLAAVAADAPVAAAPADDNYSFTVNKSCIFAIFIHCIFMRTKQTATLH